MYSFRVLNRRVQSVFVASAIVFAAVAPGMISVLVSAAQVTERSIALSSSSVSATNVSYDVRFTAADDAAAFVLDFCSNTPIIGQTCTAPTGFNASGAASASAGVTNVATGASKLVIDKTIAADDDVVVVLTGITNPSTVGPMYARIVTYSDAGSADTYTSTALGSNTVDQGGVALSITNTVGVSGAVLESMTFCVSKVAISANCTGTTTPVLALGETVGDTVALVPSAVSEGSIHTQISTNAVGGAIVSLKSSALNCGGLLRAGAPTACDIAPALNTDIALGQAKFGVKTATASATAGVPDATGTLQPANGSTYNNSTFALNFTGGNTAGVTSTYGDPFLDTNDAPANNQNMELTFAASVSNNTPAGTYSADLSLIATGKF